MWPGLRRAAVRFAILDPAIGCAARIMRGAVSLLVSAEERLGGAVGLPARGFNSDLRQAMIKNCTGERDSARVLIERAGHRPSRSHPVDPHLYRVT
jgi:hypothetical protein